MKVLVAEDNRVNALLLQHTLARAGHEVVLAADGIEALEIAGRQAFDALLTDWMMPNKDGIELIRDIRRLHARSRTAPVILMITMLDSDEARDRALASGADDFLTKPYTPNDLLSRLERCLARRNQPAPAREALRAAAQASPGPRPGAPPPRFAAVCIAASTGGPQTLAALLEQVAPTSRATFLIVLHAPAWMLLKFADSLQGSTRMRVHLAQDGVPPAPGNVYLAPGERHLVVRPRPLALQISDTPPENYVRPAADPLFRSAAHAFGRACVGVVLTGMGRDGAAGAAAIAAAGGIVLAQDPGSAVVASMPQAVVDLGIAAEVAALPRLAASIGEALRRTPPPVPRPAAPRASALVARP